MNCVRCEVVRAKIFAIALYIAGDTNQEIATKLTNHFGENYYLENKNIYRQNKIPPYTPYLIKGIENAGIEDSLNNTKSA